MSRWQWNTCRSQVASVPTRQSNRTRLRATACLDLEELDGSARSLFAGITPLPPTELTLCRFVAYLASERLRAQSILGYLSAIRHLFIEAGLPPLPREVCPRLQYTLRGVTRSQIAQPAPQKLPITPRILLALKSAWESGIVEVSMARLLWALSLTAFFGCFRISELTVKDLSSPPAIRVSDVSFDQSPAWALLLLRFSKTDPGGTGVSVVIGATGGPLCPVQALANYLTVRSRAPGPLFVLHNGRPISWECFVGYVRAALASLGVNPACYTGHSFRIGAATAAARA
ncbi:PREDICTED: uncharacterized protein LOC100634784 [Amphimedon queenslandica]|uniref:Tyr recombinase domain-containing protein n=1 Tax=Amphimedon queenslandica TaxID=400682 RepID=A0AAN0IPL6_AMPQE|nr:PREDICTED: uncharacterized protein LOC100634784 [Amphimedon queenslandica]|eukprot:XP_011406192.1 PREDICTED: uncharacterized protein LOC100634784 [Amphimedon queenslandica]